jgi:hypothetical protein
LPLRNILTEECGAACGRRIESSLPRLSLVSSILNCCLPTFIWQALISNQTKEIRWNNLERKMRRYTTGLRMLNPKIKELFMWRLALSVSLSSGQSRQLRRVSNCCIKKITSELFGSSPD